MRKRCGLARHRSNGHCKVRSLLVVGHFNFALDSQALLNITFIIQAISVCAWYIGSLRIWDQVYSGRKDDVKLDTIVPDDQTESNIDAMKQLLAHFILGYRGEFSDKKRVTYQFLDEVLFNKWQFDHKRTFVSELLLLL